MPTEKNWSKEFLEYMEKIVSHDSYSGIPYVRNSEGKISWIAAKKSKIGRKRIEWALNKAKELEYIEKPGVYAKVMLEIHPFKEKPCQICGKKMSLYYVYLNAHLCNSLNNHFHTQFSICDSLYFVFDSLMRDGINPREIMLFFASQLNIPFIEEERTQDFIKRCELLCRTGGSNKLGPGAMSNYPDRLDGFHTYNRCCRAIEDTGRHKENMKTYGKDRRAYEYWSDGNIHAANKFMNSSFFKGTSADHIGPISLGFKHDSLLLRKMSANENSTKRDHLLREDIEELIKIEKNNPNFSAMSWFSESIWLFIKDTYKKVESITPLRDSLKQNIVNYLELIWMIKNNCGDNGKEFLIVTLLKPKFDYFNYNYEFNELGEIVSRTKRNITDSTRKEIMRFIRISFESVDDYHTKENRNLKTILDINEYNIIEQIQKHIDKKDFNNAYVLFKRVVSNMEKRIVDDLRAHS